MSGTNTHYQNYYHNRFIHIHMEKQECVCDSNKGPGSVGAVVFLLKMKCFQRSCRSLRPAESSLSTVESESLAGN